MLRLLHIENIAVIEEADITFGDGFNVLTGETGAGKSIVIDAISAIMGERAYRDMIRTGTSKATVRGIFDNVPSMSWFEENGVPYDEELMIQREIYLDGKNISRVNGVPVTVSILKKLGIQLINIHGQHDSAALFDETYHLSMLDSFGETDTLLREYTDAYEKIRKEAPYHALTNAGHITYVELDGDTAHNLAAFESVIRCMHDAGIGYGSVNHPVDRDPVCGYTGVIGDVCPRCGRRAGEGVSVEKLRALRKLYPDMPYQYGVEE